MNSYEMTFITASDKKEILTALEKLITDLKGTISEQKPWGKREFAYTIKKLTEGYYFTWYFSLEAPSLAEFRKKMDINTDILRYLLLKKD
ncbi:MAG: 30S ribosomal protein S6 [Candidatus Roizmanbacteria bacterium]